MEFGLFDNWFYLGFLYKVHITQGDHEGKAVIVSWVTMDETGSSTVVYWSEKSKHKCKASGKVTSYTYYNYTSGYIHHCNIKNLKVNILSFIPFLGWIILVSWAFVD